MSVLVLTVWKLRCCGGMVLLQEIMKPSLQVVRLNLTTLQVKILLPCEERGEMQFCRSSFVRFALINFLYLGKYLCKESFKFIEFCYLKFNPCKQ